MVELHLYQTRATLTFYPLRLYLETSSCTFKHLSTKTQFILQMLTNTARKTKLKMETVLPQVETWISTELYKYSHRRQLTLTVASAQVFGDKKNCFPDNLMTKTTKKPIKLYNLSAGYSLSTLLVRR